VPLLIAAGTLALALALPVVVHAQGRSETEVQQDLDSIRRQIEEQRSRIEKSDSQQESILTRLEKTDRDITKTRVEINRLQRRRAKLKKEVQEIQTRIAQNQKALADQQKWVARRLRARYQFGELGTLKVIMSSDSIADLTKRQKFLDLVFDQDSVILDHYRQTLAALEADRARLQKAEAELLKNEADRRAAEQRLVQQKKDQQAVLLSVKDEKKDHLKVLAELEESEKDLEKILSGLSRRAPSSPSEDLALFKGSLCYPVKGTVEEGFGQKENPRFHTMTFRKGIDLRAPAGAPIRSIHAGTVLFADWFRGYGKLLILDHGNGYYSLYAHADALTKSVGDEVKKGEVIGSVGDTGSLKGPYLYFELRLHSQPLDPVPWLDAKCK
jgi:murein hydrolase activator